MKIEKEKYVSIDYELKVEGEIVDKSEPGQPLGFVSGVGQIVPGLDNAIQGKEVGDSLDVKFSAKEGYGEVREELLQELPKKNFPDELELEAGMTFQADTPHGMVNFKIAEVKDDVVIADLNHPLAGKDLHFSVKIAEVRDATEEELTPACDDDHECHSCGQH
jgi:FKBP-type peptidyl-prolyl cis-trans isomerase SlyD